MAVMLRNFFGRLFAVGSGSGLHRCSVGEFEATAIQ
jgi:hypothetical protein